MNINNYKPFLILFLIKRLIIYLLHYRKGKDFMKVVSQWSHSLKNIVVQRHKSIHLSNPSLFLKRIGELLNEGYTISEAIHLVLPFHTEQYKEATDEIQLLLKRGEGIASIFNALGFSNQLLVSLYVAEKSGDVAFCLMHNAQYLTAVEKT